MNINKSKLTSLKSLDWIVNFDNIYVTKHLYIICICSSLNQNSRYFQTNTVAIIVNEVDN